MTRTGTLVATTVAAGAFGTLIAGTPRLALPFLIPVVAGAGWSRVGRGPVADRRWPTASPLDACRVRLRRPAVPASAGALP